MFFVCQEAIVKLLRNTDAWRILVQVLLSTTSQLTVCHYNESRALICLEGRRFRTLGPAMPVTYRKSLREEGHTHSSTLFQQIHRRSVNNSRTPSSFHFSQICHLRWWNCLIFLISYVWITGYNLFGSVGLFLLFSYPYPTYWNTSWSRLWYSSACGYGRVKTLADVSVQRRYNCYRHCSIPELLILCFRKIYNFLMTTFTLAHSSTI